jgi:hypothetical protein
MNTYLISFQIKSNEAYGAIAEKLRSFPRWARTMDNVWVVKSEYSAADIRDEISALIKEVGGTILVVNISEEEWASYALSQEVANWMKQNI